MTDENGCDGGSNGDGWILGGWISGISRILSLILDKSFTNPRP